MIIGIGLSLEIKELNNILLYETNPNSEYLGHANIIYIQSHNH